ncbi:hypothetical protein BDZ91DRAFT_788213 [Kalaharituber pfeilii]|nr:hypothetical protein BDZ91DRAFT_788213 [Kalaharituber pfeilii]
MALLASNVMMVTAAPPRHIATTKPVHLDRRSTSTRPVHIGKRTADNKPYHIATARSSGNDMLVSTKLKPVRVEDLSNPVQRREIVNDYSRLDLLSHAQMVYAAQEGSGKGVMIANMTLYSPNGIPVIMMERFEGLTKAVDCEVKTDGFISLTLSDEKGFQHAREAWDWINQGEDDEFIMITDHDGCAPEEERKAYHIHQIEYRESDLFIKLYAHPAPWEEVAGSYELEFASLKPKDAPRLVRSRRSPKIVKARGVLDWFKDKFEDIKDKFSDLKEKFGDKFDEIVDTLGELGDKTFDEVVSWDISAGQPGERKNIYTDILQKENPRQVIDCTDCYIKGQLQFGGHLVVDNFIPQEAWWTVSPEDFEAKLEINMKLKKTEGDPLNINLDVINIPFGGITIPNIFNLGPKFEFEIGVTTDIRSDMDITFGALARVPNEALVKGDILQFEKSEVTGWDGASLDGLPLQLNSGAVEASFEFRGTPVLGLELYAIGLVAYEAALKFNVPRITTVMTTEEDPAGVCEKSETAQTTGIKVNTEVGLGVEFVVGKDAILGAKPDFQATLFEKKFPLDEKCHPVGEPRVLPPPTETERF